MSEHAVAEETPPVVEEPAARRPPLGALLTLLGGLMAVSAAVVFYLGLQDAEDTAGTAVAQRDQVVEAADVACEKPQRDVQLTLLCAEVEAAKANPVQAPAEAEAVDYARVRTMVSEALALDPRLSESALLGLVQGVYRQNPPTDGKTPAPSELLALIRQVYAADPPAPGEDGEPGADGQSGQNAFCFDNPEDPACQPREGRPGADGAAGEPPFGWTTAYPDGSREDCRRADEFDPQQPRYVCAFTPADPPPTSDGGLLPGG